MVAHHGLILGASGQTNYSSSYYCTSCNAYKIAAGGTITARCNSCGTSKSYSVSGHVWCRNCWAYIGSISGYQCDAWGNAANWFAGSCTATVQKTKYVRSCGLTSGILDQD